MKTKKRKIAFIGRAKIENVNLSRRSNAYEPGLLERLKDLSYAAEYLTHCIDPNGEPEEEFEIFLSALEKIVKASGVEDVADKMDLKRDTLYKMFKHKNPTAINLLKLLSAVGLKLAIEEVSPAPTAKRTAATR